MNISPDILLLHSFLSLKSIYEFARNGKGAMCNTGKSKVDFGRARQRDKIPVGTGPEAGGPA